MSKMGLGYGSEYQLLRFLGHHRKELDNAILSVFKPAAASIDWLDYPRDPNRLSLDNEFEGIDFFPSVLQQKLSANWKDYWPQKGTAPNWDGIAIVEGTWLVVEAKAHLDELKAQSDAEAPESIKTIDDAFTATQKHFGIKPPHHWREGNSYYQLANRLAFINFLHSNGIDARLLYVYFLNGWPDDAKSVTSKDAWRTAIDAEYAYLGINAEAERYILEVFIDCK